MTDRRSRPFHCLDSYTQAQSDRWCVSWAMLGVQRESEDPPVCGIIWNVANGHSCMRVHTQAHTYTQSLTHSEIVSSLQMCVRELFATLQHKAALFSGLLAFHLFLPLLFSLHPSLFCTDFLFFNVWLQMFWDCFTSKLCIYWALVWPLVFRCAVFLKK